ncbi:hypothetical protein LW139_07590 [Proteus vulgaris]|uniref:phage baseplate plug family protein n=1 Tax=Proteus vulgaris TaxID=585 RepID=UPI00200020DE|nr:hypothetical protein [Proteus vulgaris]UPK82542.1 hypothetical protein LW139_07590 [Proteus vulgaris]
MKVIPLKAIPNQRLSVNLEGVNWTLTIKAGRNAMYIDIERENVVIAIGMRAVANTPIIPYRYLANGTNLAFITENDDLPWYESFDRTQSLIIWSDDGLTTNTSGD